MSEARENAAAAIADLGLTIESKFIPFSFSQSRDDKDENGKTRYSLNWEITLKRGDREVLRTNYSAGVSHVPNYRFRACSKGDPNAKWGMRIEKWKANWACETGFVMKYLPGSGGTPEDPDAYRPVHPRVAIPNPDIVDVLWCLILDSSVIDYRSFEEWAPEYGYDPDSRSAEKIYRDCLESALALRAAIGEEGLQKLSEAFQDF